MSSGAIELSAEHVDTNKRPCEWQALTDRTCRRRKDGRKRDAGDESGECEVLVIIVGFLLRKDVYCISVLEDFNRFVGHFMDIVFFLLFNSFWMSNRGSHSFIKDITHTQLIHFSSFETLTLDHINSWNDIMINVCFYLDALKPKDTYLGRDTPL